MGGQKKENNIVSLATSLAGILQEHDSHIRVAERDHHRCACTPHAAKNQRLLGQARRHMHTTFIVDVLVVVVFILVSVVVVI